ncbi:glucosyltransferase domain-containing protein [Xenorhabdus szentirmaii]|uniref:glucosyltransferase domain-containing protein n=1 Tax=Xenorhabdus szentirmaii TaxID=290112 RepID=UPI0019A817DF|nr:glucosyltransferase domain-containing protein [Xenorhabdus sp. 38]MBD2782396.1 glucosyltransferase domain-containing protein [Xenorhabdus sp. 38]
MKYKMTINNFILASIVFCFPIILADVYFRDDIPRAIYSFIGLSKLGRPIADFTYSIITGFNPGVDISPLPLILSSVILAIISFLLSKKVFQCTGIFGLLVSTPIISSPFFLQNLSYKYDNLPMTLSVLFSTMPFFINRDNKLKFYLLSTILLIMALCSYQTAINIYFCLIFVTNIIYFQNNNFSFKAIIEQINFFAPLLSAIVIYKLIILNLFIDSQGMGRSSLANINNIINNIIKFNDDIIQLVKSDILYLIIPIILIVFFNSICNLYKNKNHFFLSIAIFLISIILSYLSIGGISILLDEGIAGPRSYMSFGIFLSLIFYLSIKTNSNTLKYLSISFIILLISFMYSYSYAYGNALKTQRNYEMVIVNNLFNRLSEINHDNKKKVFISGSIKTPKLTDSIYYMNSSMRRLNPLSEWSTRFIVSSYDLNVDWSWGEYEEMKNSSRNGEYDLVYKNNNYTIYKTKDGNLFVIF